MFIKKVGIYKNEKNKKVVLIFFCRLSQPYTPQSIIYAAILSII